MSDAGTDPAVTMINIILSRAAAARHERRTPETLGCVVALVAYLSWIRLTHLYIRHTLLQIADWQSDTKMISQDD